MKIYNKSFTIVELLVVMAVIGVLLSLSVFGIQALQKSQRETQRLTTLRDIESELESYYARYRRYPISFTPSDYSFGEMKLSNDPYSVSLYYDDGAGNLTPFGSAIILQSPKAEIGSSRDYTNSACTNETDTSADKWYINYIYGSSVKPQEYGLWGCTENGATPLFGSKTSTIPCPTDATCY